MKQLDRKEDVYIYILHVRNVLGLGRFDSLRVDT